MAEEKKDFPWIQLIATVGTIAAALIGITPYILKLNSTPAPQTPTIVFITLPPAVTTPAPATTQPATPVETTPVATQTTVLTTIPTTTGPPPTTGNETIAPTTTPTTVPTTEPIVPTTTAATTAPVPSIQISVNATSVPQGGLILASGTTDATVPQVTITLKNSTTFQSSDVPADLTQGMFRFLVDTSAYAPGDYTIYAAVPDTAAIASAFFSITAG